MPKDYLGMKDLQLLTHLKEVWGGMRITPFLQLRVSVDNHAATHTRHSKELYVIARISIDQHTVFRRSY